MTETVRVFVGTAANGEDAESQAVLEWSIRKHSSLPVEIEWMQQSSDPTSFWSGWNTLAWATPFSGFRWGIPQRCGFKGRAIYTDSDVIFNADIAELWRTPMADRHSVVAKGAGSWRFCVSLWDCERVQPHVDQIGLLRDDPGSHRRMSNQFRNAPFVQPFDASQNWNCLDGEDLALNHPSVKAIHYTVMANQPHLKYAIPRLAAAGQKHWFDGKVQPHWRIDLVEMFDALLLEAAANGYPTERYTPPEDVALVEYRKRSMKNYKSGPRHV